MTATDKLRQKLIHLMTGELVEVSAIPERMAELSEEDAFSESLNELRGSGEETGLPCPYSRHYEAKAVAAQMLDGSWVGWTYWYGGGKHGEPSEMPWLDDAYGVTVSEVQRVVREFSVTDWDSPGT